MGRSGETVAPARSAAVDRGATAAKRKLSFNEPRELETLPQRIEALEAEQRALRAEMESPEFYKAGAERIHVVMARVEEAGREHERLLERWMALEERR